MFLKVMELTRTWILLRAGHFPEVIFFCTLCIFLFILKEEANREHWLFFLFLAIYCIFLHMRLCIVRISLACVTQVDLQLWRHVLYYNCLLLWHITYNKMLPTSEGIDIAIMCLNCFMRTTRLPGRGGGLLLVYLMLCFWQHGRKKGMC